MNFSLPIFVIDELWLVRSVHWSKPCSACIPLRCWRSHYLSVYKYELVIKPDKVQLVFTVFESHSICFLTGIMTAPTYYLTTGWSRTSALTITLFLNLRYSHWSLTLDMQTIFTSIDHDQSRQSREGSENTAENVCCIENMGKSHFPVERISKKMKRWIARLNLHCSPSTNRSRCLHQPRSLRNATEFRRSWVSVITS